MNNALSYLKRGVMPIKLITPRCNVDTVVDGGEEFSLSCLKVQSGEWNLIFTEAGKSRGYHYHPEFDEYVRVVSGAGVYQSYDTHPDISSIVKVITKVSAGGTVLFPSGDLIRMQHFDELSHAEIAHELDIPVGTVKSRTFARTGVSPASWTGCVPNRQTPRAPTARGVPMDDFDLTQAERAALERVQGGLADPAVWAEPPPDLQESVVAAIGEEARTGRKGAASDWGRLASPPRSCSRRERPSPFR